MYIWVVHALGSQFFPHIWYRIQPENVNTLIRQGQQHFHNLIEYLWVFIIQIPLKFIKTGHYKFLEVWVPGEVPRGNARENFCHMLLIFFRDRVIVKHKIHVVVIMVALPVFLHPDMLLCRMVQHKVNTGADALGL